MKPHLEKAHAYWRKILQPTDRVVDATCGNGKDTRVLAEIVSQGHVFSFDIQEEALHRARLHADLPNISFIHKSHVFLPSNLDIRLIVYNLGYLPGGNKAITTQTEETLESLKQAIQITRSITITCYPGHQEGAREEQAVDLFCKTLQGWSVQCFKWQNGKPSLFILELN